MANKTRPNKVIFRLSDEELEVFKDKVKASGKNQQEYCMRAVLEAKICNTDGLKALLPELGKQGSNLNQIAKTLNENGFVDYKRVLQTALVEHSETLKQIRELMKSGD